MEREQQLKEEICQVGKAIWARGMCSANSGNISARLGPNEIVITPTLVSKGFMRPEQILTMNLAGEVLRGEGYPTSETPMHLRLFREREDIGGIVHAHPPKATAFAVAGKALDLYLVPEVIVFLGQVPVVPFQMPGSAELGEGLVPYLKEYDAVLMQNHGAIAWAADLTGAHHRMETLEFFAEITLNAQLLGGANEVPMPHRETLVNLRKMMKGTA